MDKFLERISLNYVNEIGKDYTVFTKSLESGDGIYLEEVAEAVLQFLNGAGFTYVTGVIFTKTNGDEVSTL